MEVGASIIKKSLSKKDFPHAFLFFGPRGTGKTTTARLTAKALNCLDLQKDGEPCLKCSNCKAFEKDNFLDLIEIDAASNRGIDDVRSLKETVMLAPSMGKYKVYIIDEVHMMTKDAFNALLKTLEEPPAHCVFILATTEKEKIPATIVSRCQQITFKRAKSDDVSKKLEFIAKSEGAKIEKDVIQKIAIESDGGFRDAENMLEQIVSGGAKIDDILGGLSDEKIYEFTAFLAKKDYKSAIKAVNAFFSNGVDLEVFNRQFLKVLRDILYFSLGLQKDLYEGLEDSAKKLQQLSKEYTQEEIRKALGIFGALSGHINKHPFPTLCLQLAILDYCLGGVTSQEVKDDSGNPNPIPDKPAAKSASVASAPLQAPSSKISAPPAVAKSATPASFGSFSWDAFLQAVKPFNHSLEALLRSCRLVEAGENSFVVEAFYKFHKERLEVSQNKKILQDVLAQNFNIKVPFICNLAQKVTVEKKAATSNDYQSPFSAEPDTEEQFNAVPDFVSNTPIPEGEAADVFSGDL